MALRIVKLNTEDNRELFEIARLQDADDFMSLEALIRRSRKAARDMCENQTGENLYRAQGIALAFKELLEACEQAKVLVGSPTFRLHE